ncbi:MAG TPA: hypothetical protein PLO28_14595, partial [bacterium]|nr:hypothetical protein [bacterium]
DNIGVAPPYRAYIPAFEIRKAGTRGGGGLVVRQETDWPVREWLPGRHVQSAQMQLAESLPPGRYLVYFALLDPFTKVPAVKLAVDGLDAQGWYSWTSFEVVGKGGQ